MRVGGSVKIRRKEEGSKKTRVLKNRKGGREKIRHFVSVHLSAGVESVGTIYCSHCVQKGGRGV